MLGAWISNHIKKKKRIKKTKKTYFQTQCQILVWYVEILSCQWSTQNFGCCSVANAANADGKVRLVVVKHIIVS